MKWCSFLIIFCVIFTFFSCIKADELSLEELEALDAEGLREILAKTQTKPWQGEDFVPGTLGGTWNSSMIKDPKSFNHLIAERDGETAAIMRMMTEYLFEYNVVRREWKPKAASFEVVIDEANQTLDLICTLRDDLYWSYFNSDDKIPVTSDDVVLASFFL